LDETPFVERLREFSGFSGDGMDYNYDQRTELMKGVIGLKIILVV
jgi:hypothetical protein